MEYLEYLTHLIKPDNSFILVHILRFDLVNDQLKGHDQ
jgi:hypothetical protein